MIYTLRSSMTTKAGIEEAFRVFENPANLAAITPPWLKFRILTPEVRVAAGERFDYRLSWMGIGLTWRTLIEEYNPPYSFVDVQERGPYTLWRHRHTFEAVEGGTLVSDEVTYSLPLGVLGRLAHAIAVERQLNEIFRYRREAIAGLLGDTDQRNPNRA